MSRPPYFHWLVSRGGGQSFGLWPTRTPEDTLDQLSRHAGTEADPDCWRVFGMERLSDLVDRLAQDIDDPVDLERLVDRFIRVLDRHGFEALVEALEEADAAGTL